VESNVRGLIATKILSFSNICVISLCTKKLAIRILKARN